MDVNSIVEEGKLASKRTIELGIFNGETTN
jgi:hypothetical protein